MLEQADRDFGEKFLKSIDNFYTHGVHWLFNEWWESAPQDAIDKYEAAIADHPEIGPLAREGWMAPDFTLAAVEQYAPGTLGHAWRSFVVDNDLVEQLAAGYEAYHRDLMASGKLDRMPELLQYKVLRGYQTHDLHHVLAGYPATPLGEISLQAFQLAQMNYPYAAMWLAVVTSHMALVDPFLTEPVMDAITEGWAHGRSAKSLQFVKFEQMLDRDLESIRAEYRLQCKADRDCATPIRNTPELLAGVG